MRSLFIAILLPFALVSCGSHKTLQVNRSKLRDTQSIEGEFNLNRAEAKYRLFGAVSKAEQKQHIGEYLTVRWHGDRKLGGVEITLEYQQARSGRRILSKTHSDPNSKGIHEFAIAGEEFQKGGRLLTWKISLKQAGEVIATKQSYLWE